MGATRLTIRGVTWNRRGGDAALLIFFAIALQCMSTVVVVRRETVGWKWPIYMGGLALRSPEVVLLGATHSLTLGAPIRAPSVRSREEIKTTEKREFSTDEGLLMGPTTHSGVPLGDFVSPHGIMILVFGISSQFVSERVCGNTKSSGRGA